MMNRGSLIDQKLARQLVFDELFDLTLYQELARISTGPTKVMLDELIVVEKKHHLFWRDFFKFPEETLDRAHRVKINFFVAGCRILGDAGVHLILEAIEIHGIRKYLAIWKIYEDTPLGEAVRTILNDEFKHEDAVVSGLAQRKISPERIRSIFLGLNDGLVEMIGAVSGFAAAFDHPTVVLMAGLTVAIAGSLSMAFGAYSASSSEEEVRKIQEGKERFLGLASSKETREKPHFLAFLVGVSYFWGAMIPLGPVLMGFKTIWVSFCLSAGAAVGVSSVLAFLSGMNLRRRVMINVSSLATAVAVTYGIGRLARAFWGLEL